jgi:hypothetical protein
MSDFEDSDEDEALRIYSSVDRPHQRALHLVLDLFHEQPCPGVNYRWLITQLDLTAAALREAAHDLRVQEQQAEQERRKRLQVIKGGDGND